MSIKTPTKYAKIFGIDLEYEQQLTDAEFRIYCLYLRIVDWDEKHGDKFGFSDISINEILNTYLPKDTPAEWSRSKISETRNQLVKKGWLTRKDNRAYGIPHLHIRRMKNVREAEQLIHQIRQGVQIDEQEVRDSEQQRNLSLDEVDKIFGSVELKRLN